jgi:thiamine transport system permease protein
MGQDHGEMKGNRLLYPALGFLFLFFLIPYLSVLAYGLENGGSALREAVRNPVSLRVLGFTFGQALASTAFSLALGLPGAWILGRYSFRGQNLVKAVATVPFVLPSILVVLGFVMFFGNNGVLNRFLMDLTGTDNPPLRILYAYRAIILAHGFYNFPICLRIVSSAWEQEPRSLIHASRTLGAGRLRAFLTVTLPRLLPSIGASAVLIFLFCFNSFAVILVLGGGPRFSTMEVEIYRQARMILDLGAASALSIISSMVSLAAVIVFFLLSRAGSGDRWPEERSGRKKPPLSSLPVPGKALAAAYLLLIVLLVLGPMASIAFRSLANPASMGGVVRFSLDGYRSIFSPAAGAARALPVIRSILLSLGVAAAAASVSVIFASAAVSTSAADPVADAASSSVSQKLRRILAVLSLLPMGISPIILGLGYLRFTGFTDNAAAPLLLVMIHAVISFPFAFQSVSAAARQLTPGIVAAGRSLGGSRFDVFRRITGPILLPGILTGFSFSAAISLGEIRPR